MPEVLMINQHDMGDDNNNKKEDSQDNKEGKTSEATDLCCAARCAGEGSHKKKAEKEKEPRLRPRRSILRNRKTTQKQRAYDRENAWLVNC